MPLSTPHLLALIALIAALVGGGIGWFPGTDARASVSGLALAVLLLCVAVLVQ